MTKLDRPLKREISIDRKAYVLTTTANGLKIALQCRRKEQAFSRLDIMSGQAALGTAPNALLHQTRGAQRERSPSSMFMREPEDNSTFVNCRSAIQFARKEVANPPGV